MGSVTGTVVDYEAVTTSDYGYSTILDLTLRLALKGGELYPLLGEGLSVGDTLRIVQCDGEEKENDWEEVGDVLDEATHLYGDKFFFGVWRARRGRWCAGFYNPLSHPCDYAHPLKNGDTPLEAAQNLLEKVKRRKGFLVDPHGEEWGIEQCIEWLEERGEISTGATNRTAYLWEKDSFEDGGRLIAKASSASSWVDAYRDLVVATWLRLKTREGN